MFVLLNVAVQNTVCCAFLSVWTLVVFFLGSVNFVADIATTEYHLVFLKSIAIYLHLINFSKIQGLYQNMNS